METILGWRKTILGYHFQNVNTVYPFISILFYLLSCLYIVYFTLFILSAFILCKNICKYKNLIRKQQSELEKTSSFPPDTSPDISSHYEQRSLAPHSKKKVAPAPMILARDFQHTVQRNVSHQPLIIYLQ